MAGKEDIRLKGKLPVLDAIPWPFHPVEGLHIKGVIKMPGGGWPSLILKLGCMVLILALAALTPGLAWAGQSEQAKIVALSGQARLISPDGQERDAAVGNRLPSGWAVETGAGGRATLQLEGGSTAEVYEQSRVKVNDLFGTEEKESSLSLLLGHIHMKVKKLFAPELVHTPTMIAGVRGTDFTVSVADDGSSIVSVAEGKVSVSTDKEGESMTEASVEAGREVQVDEAGRSPYTRPRKMKTYDDFKMFRKKRFENLIQRLPLKVSRMEKGVDSVLGRLEKTKAAMVIKAGNLQKLARQTRAATRDNPSRVKLLKRQMLQEAVQILRLGRSYRIHSMRLGTVFARGRRLVNLLPGIKGRLGDQYEQVEKGLSAVLGRQREARTRMKSYSRDIKAALMPVSPMLYRARQLAKTKGVGQGGGPRDGMKRRPGRMRPSL